MKIAITGGAGFIGTELSKHLLASGHEIVVLDIAPSKITHPNLISLSTNLSLGKIPSEVAHSDAIIHLAGVNIFGNWTTAYKEQILKSRTESTKALITFLKENSHQVKTFVSASAIGYYGDTGEYPTDESGENGQGFLASVCKEWEAEVAKAQELGIRTVSVRTGIVLGKNGGMLQKLIPAFSLGLGGRMGSGQQWFSWIALSDLVRVYEEAVRNPALSGPINAVAPQSVRNSELAHALGKVFIDQQLFHYQVGHFDSL